MSRTIRIAAFCFAILLAAAPAAQGEELRPGVAKVELKGHAGAHRGGGGLWPEATLYAYQHCAERWPDMLLEGDVQTTSDGELVMMHDATVNRTTDGEGLITAKTFEEVRALDAGYHFKGPEGDFPFRGKGLQVPTFAEVLAACPNHQFLIETKHGEKVVEKTIEVIRAAGAESRVIVASFNPLHMGTFREKAPEIARCFDPSNALLLFTALNSGDWQGYEPAASYLAFSPGLAKQIGATAENFKAIQAKGIPVQVHTVNSPEAIREYLAMGIDLVLSDYPDRVYEALDEAKP
ncbi:MAG: hypothetical protein GC168_03540 [Candidatus Hydrogenedens sp.]|nr:hypothetical protein [Candidatus Hydrogenedens sp.]